MKKFVSILLVCIMLVGVMPVVSAANGEMPFKDVKSGSWYYDAVQYCYNHGLMTGTADDKFSPALGVTRAMVCVVLWRQAGSPSPKASNHFKDVPNGRWYSDAINWMYEIAAVSGIGGGKFGPNRKITRQDMATILYGYADVMRYEVTNRTTIYVQDLGNGEKEGIYKDGLSVSRYAVIGMEWCVANKFIVGTTKTTLSPNDTITRSQMATILYRFCTWLETNPKHYIFNDMDIKRPTETSPGYIRYEHYENGSLIVYYHYIEKGATLHYATKSELQKMARRLNGWLSRQEKWVVTEDYQTESWGIPYSLNPAYYVEDMYASAKRWTELSIAGTEDNPINYGHVGLIWDSDYQQWFLVVYFG